VVSFLLDLLMGAPGRSRVPATRCDQLRESFGLPVSSPVRLDVMQTAALAFDCFQVEVVRFQERGGARSNQRAVLSVRLGDQVLLQYCGDKRWSRSEPRRFIWRRRTEGEMI
jgi:hypothetical protein